MLDTVARGRFSLRYEDVSQDGVVRLDTLTTSLGVVWRASLLGHPLVDACRREAILPILTELEIAGEEGPFAVEGDLEVTGRADLAHVPAPGGGVARLLLDIATDLDGELGRTNLPPPERAGQRARAGRVFARHVFTRPFAPAGERRVLALPDTGGALPDVPPERADWEEPEAYGGVPDGAREVAPPADDPAPVVFGYLHTDSNQHVNSLVYPRLFEEALLRRLASAGLGVGRHAASLRVGFRKPSFVGDRLTVRVGIHDVGGRLVGAGGFYGDDGRMRVAVRLALR